ncbi:fatty acid--CoA ligase [Palleronia sp. KMU-117]|uniref:fatty acid--CoA ligase n=1 Tax=Palleronia sp. KMU-117 TaxID=3434108 RepID=UPI003D7627C2
MELQSHDMLTIGRILAAPLLAQSDRTISCGDVSLSYPDFARRVARLGGALAALGLGQGSVVAVMDWDSNRYLEAFFAVPMAGATLHTINIRLSPEQILYTIEHAEDDAILVHEDFLPLLSPLLPRISRPLRLILLTDRADAPLPEGFAGEYERLLAAASADHAFPDLDERTRATLFYTTGTTGDPKGVFYSHRQLVLHTLGGAVGLGRVPGPGGLHLGDVYMPITPLFHVHGWGFPYVATFLGLDQVYPGRYDPERLLDLIARHGVTFSHCVPTILAMLLSAAGAEAADLSRWKVLIGGSALSEGLAQRARDKGIDVNTAYGMSETCPILTMADMAQGADADIAVRTSTGKPHPLVEVRVVDDEMRDVPRDGRSTGEVVVRAPWLTEGYLKAPEATAALWRGGWLHTGDVGSLSPDGTLRITDRLKDVIKSGGEWVSSLALENAVSTVPGVREVAAVGIPDPRWGERPVVVIAAENDAFDATARAAMERVSQAVSDGTLPRWATPDRILRVDALPKTSVGKIDKKAIRAAIAEGEIT